MSIWVVVAFVGGLVVGGAIGLTGGAIYFVYRTLRWAFDKQQEATQEAARNVGYVIRGDPRYN